MRIVMSRTGCVLRNANCCPTERCTYVRTIDDRQCELCKKRVLSERRVPGEAAGYVIHSVEDPISNPGSCKIGIPLQKIPLQRLSNIFNSFTIKCHKYGAAFNDKSHGADRRRDYFG